MRIKQHLTLRVQRLTGHLKSIGLLVWVPVLVLDVLLPIMIFLSYRKEGVTERLLSSIIKLTSLLIPFFSTWWGLFVLREYMEADGNELLFVCKNRNKFRDMSAIFFLYIANVSILYLGMGILWFPSMGLELVRMLCNCLWYFGLLFFLCFLTHSITTTLMLLLLYTLANVVFPITPLFYPMYHSLMPVNKEFLQGISLPLAISGILLLFGGIILNKKRLKYN